VSPPDPALSLRQRTWRAVRQEITEAALQLFLERGFDATTVDQIAEAAGISRRSFFRYFETKEDVVLGDLMALGEQVHAALQARPADESAWVALRAAFATLQEPQRLPATELAIAQICHGAPTLRARHLEKHLYWQELLAPEIEKRLGTASATHAGLQARAIVASALACLDTAVEAWRESGGRADLEELYDEAVAAVRA